MAAIEVDREVVVVADTAVRTIQTCQLSFADSADEQNTHASLAFYLFCVQEGVEATAVRAAAILTATAEAPDTEAANRARMPQLSRIALMLPAAPPFCVPFASFHL